jgi:alkylation response protein AidB-like acyl-CoA dehydrogenase
MNMPMPAMMGEANAELGVKRAARPRPHHQGTNEIRRMLIGRELFGESA